MKAAIINKIEYRSQEKITAAEFVDLLKRSTLDERRPVDDLFRIQKMLDHGNILVTAWAGDILVGISRALSDFSFCCYLSDLAVDEAYQRQGIGKRLIEETQKVAGESAMLILLAAPAAISYYPKIGMEQFQHCFVIKPKATSTHLASCSTRRDSDKGQENQESVSVERGAKQSGAATQQEQRHRDEWPGAAEEKVDRQSTKHPTSNRRNGHQRECQWTFGVNRQSLSSRTVRTPRR